MWSFVKGNYKLFIQFYYVNFAANKQISINEITILIIYTGDLQILKTRTLVDEQVHI